MLFLSSHPIYTHIPKNFFLIYSVCYSILVIVDTPTSMFLSLTWLWTLMTYFVWLIVTVNDITSFFMTNVPQYLSHWSCFTATLQSQRCWPITYFTPISEICLKVLNVSSHTMTTITCCCEGYDEIFFLSFKIPVITYGTRILVWPWH